MLDQALTRQLIERGMYDKLRELQAAEGETSLFKNINKEVRTLTKEIIRAPLRAVGTLQLQSQGREQMTPGAEGGVMGTVEKLLFGEQPIRNIKGTGESTLEFLGVKQAPAPLAIGIGLASTALDLWPGIGKSRVAKEAVKIAATSNLDNIMRSLKSLTTNTTKELYPVAKELQSITNQKKITTILNKVIKPTTWDDWAKANPRVPDKVGYALSIKIDRISSIDDIQDIIKTTAETNRPQFEAATRGVMPWEATKRLADQLMMTEKKFLDTTEIGKARNAEETYAASNLLKTMTTNLSKKAKEIAAGGDTTLNKTLFRDMMEKTYAIQKGLSMAKTETGRALNINKVLAREIPPETMALNKMLEAMGGHGITDEMIQKFVMIDPTDTLAVNKFIRGAVEVKTADKVYWVWLNSILSSPTTHIVNTTSNTFMAALQPVIRAGEATFELAKGRQREKFFGEVPAQLVGSIAGLTEGVRKGFYVLRHGVRPEDVTKLDIASKTAQPIKGKIGTIISMPTRGLVGEDEFFKAVVGTGEMYAQAYRKAAKEGLRGTKKLDRMAELINNPTDDMFEAAKELALEATFQKQLGKIGDSVMKARDIVPGLRWVVPFIKTPTNIFKEALKMTPAGYINIAKKSFQGKEQDITRDLAKATIGTSLGIWAGLKTMEGKMTGSAPTDRAERDAFYRSGKLPYAIKIGDDWIQYSRIEPIATIIGGMVDGIQMYQKEQNGGEIISKTFGILGKNLITDKTFMRGISDVVEAISEPEKYGNNFIMRAAPGFIPYSGLLNYTAKLMDPVIRRPETVRQAIMNRAPVLSKELIPLRNFWGEPIEKEGNIWLRAISPAQVAQETNDPVDIELANLGITFNFIGSTITIPKEVREKLNIKEENKSIQLTQEEYDKLLKFTGQEMKKGITNMTNDPAYQAMKDEEKINMVEGLVDFIKKKNRYQILESILIQAKQYEPTKFNP